MENLSEKTALRKYFSLKRKEYGEKQKNLWDEQIFKHFFQSEIYKNCNIILAYVSVGKEADTRRIMSAALFDKKRLAVPKTFKGGKMEFVYIDSFDDLTEGPFGIPEPRETVVQSYEGEKKAVCIVPGYCFDSDGYRVGYGGGYYDRFLCNFKGVSLGLCYNQTIVEKIQSEAHDETVDYLLTEDGIKKINRREI